MKYYLSTNTIEEAYKKITSVDLGDKDKENALFYFLILKGCGINKISYETPTFGEKNGLYYASRISSLFTPEEAQPNKLGFLNPFMMREWPSQPVTEKLKSWVTSRLRNNICGGGMQWREFIEMDSREGDLRIKFKYAYLDWLKNFSLGSKTINILSMAIWSNRFSCFDKKITAKELIDEFSRTYKLTPEEITELFNSQQEFEVEFSDHMYDAGYIRGLIGGDVPGNEWTTTNMSTTNVASYVMDEYEFNVRPADVQDVSVSLVRELLNNYHQIILDGPPGTSKSYIADKIAKDYDEVIHVQFHPQYSYQNFVGGYVVDGTNVLFKKGVILNLLDSKTFDDKKKYLIIIDEFNRANVSQVLGEVIQCLDRNQSVLVNVDGNMEKISIPLNIHIIATLNTTDKTLGTVDYAIKRRFLEVYCAPNPSLLIDLCPSTGFVSLCDFLIKLNDNLLRTTGNRDLAVGHAVFLAQNVFDGSKYIWDYDKFRVLYNYKILPLISDYCSGNYDMIMDVVGNKLSRQLNAEEFVIALKEFMEIEE